MRRYTSHPERLDPPSVDTIHQKSESAKKIFSRRLNLFFGRPASPAARILGQMLNALRIKTESQLSASTYTVGIACAEGALLSTDDINDALVYSGHKKLDKWQGYDGELSAAFGAHGFGLCFSHEKPYQCEEEAKAFEDGEVVLHVEYTNKTLAANTEWKSSARKSYA